MIISLSFYFPLSFLSDKTRCFLKTSYKDLHKATIQIYLVLHGSNMALTNLTGDPKQTAFEDLACSTEFTVEVHNHLIVLLALNGFVAITAFLGNTLILVALQKETSLHAPSKLLFRNLATTDLCVGLIAEPLSIISLISALKERRNFCRYVWPVFNNTSHILSGVSLFTLTAISVDRLLALLLGLRYRQVVTLKRLYLIVVVSWIFSTAGATMILWNELIHPLFICIFVALCVVTSILSYTKIFLTLRHNQIQAQGNINQGQPSQTVQLNIARYKKTVSSALWVQVALVVCCLPYAIVKGLLLQRGVMLDITVASFYTGFLVSLNSSVNPILYCWKIREVRQAVKDTIRGLFC